MGLGFIAAVLVVGLPALALGAVLAPRISRDDVAAQALGPVAALAAPILLCSLATELRLGGWWLTAVAVAPGVAGLAWLVRRRPALLPHVWPLLGAALALGILAWPFRFVDGPGVLGYNVAND